MPQPYVNKSVERKQPRMGKERPPALPVRELPYFDKPRICHQFMLTVEQEERAAFLEYCCNMTRADAERMVRHSPGEK